MHDNYARYEIGNLSGSQIKGTDNQKYKVIAGVIRNDGTGWKYIEDSVHQKTGLSTISVTGNDIYVYYDFTAAHVNTFVVAPDETFAKYGLTVGASVGTDHSIISTYMPFSCSVIGASTISGVHSYLQNSTSITASGDGSGFTLNHAVAGANDAVVVSVADNASGIPGLDARLTYTTSSITCTAFADFYGYVSYNGTSWTVTTNNINKPTFSFDGTTGILTVTHENVNDYLDIQVTGRGSNLPAFGSIGNTTFQVKFYDYAGAVITTPNTNMQFTYRRGAKVKTTIPADMKVSLKRGYVYIPANDISEAFGNFWIYGIMPIA